MSAEIAIPLNSHDRAACLLSHAGFDGPFALVPVQGGANSKTFRVDLEGNGQRLFFKEYFRHPHDSRDRLGTEYAFASFAYAQGLRTLARPYAMDREHGCALYAYIDGHKLTSNQITVDSIRQCVGFLRSLNAHKATPQAAALPIASEACFMLEDHWECLHRRVRRLETIQPGNDLDQEALAFVIERLAPTAAAHLQSARFRARAIGLDISVLLGDSDRCLSPSDFGFHNALQTADGSLNFLDFEYAGWDDPAKTVCDFFCQPACPVPLDFWNAFAGEVAQTTSNPALSMHRFALLLPTYRLKWCCIMLNDFLPAGAGRRQFAIQDSDESHRKARQLDKARQALQQYDAARFVNQAA
ncbi:MAG: aminoglycoside phosphotransferase family protein [Gemmataceae bacterium]|nr:aminoglycoside phosphotransferase family protein [Gemmataceae bacterium]